MLYNNTVVFPEGSRTKALLLLFDRTVVKLLYDDEYKLLLIVNVLKVVLIFKKKKGSESISILKSLEMKKLFVSNDVISLWFFCNKIIEPKLFIMSVKPVFIASNGAHTDWLFVSFKLLLNSFNFFTLLWYTFFLPYEDFFLNNFFFKKKDVNTIFTKNVFFKF